MCVCAQSLSYVWLLVAPGTVAGIRNTHGLQMVLFLNNNQKLYECNFCQISTD